MEKLELASDTMTMVVLGEFDPLLVTPRWLRKMDLIGVEDYESYRIELITPNATVVNFGAIQLKVLPDTLEVSTDAVSDVEVARDLAAGILLSEGASTIGAIGINRMVHFSSPFSNWHAIGDALVPKTLWTDVIHLPGMLSLSLAGARDDGYSGAVNVQIQPSAIVQPGVFVSVNDHYTLTLTDIPVERTMAGPLAPSDAIRSVEKIAVATSIMTTKFSASRARAQSIIDRVESLGNVTGGQ
ncbi:MULTISPECIES: hypothetical protein [unclassified Streptomyces]|uniref:hypothetical protein n=1 Tax=unclassified Streptomyces TaxID=2593676 RepID=UPI003653CE73